MSLPWSDACEVRIKFDGVWLVSRETGFCSQFVLYGLYFSGWAFWGNDHHFCATCFNFYHFCTTYFYYYRIEWILPKLVGRNACWFVWNTEMMLYKIYQKHCLKCNMKIEKGRLIYSWSLTTKSRFSFYPLHVSFNLYHWTVQIELDLFWYDGISKSCQNEAQCFQFHFGVSCCFMCFSDVKSDFVV